MSEDQIPLPDSYYDELDEFPPFQIFERPHDPADPFRSRYYVVCNLKDREHLSGDLEW